MHTARLWFFIPLWVFPVHLLFFENDPKGGVLLGVHFLVASAISSVPVFKKSITLERYYMLSIGGVVVVFISCMIIQRAFSMLLD